MRSKVLPLTLSLCACTAKMVAPPGSTTPDPNAPVNEADRPGVVSYLNEGISSVRQARRRNAYQKMQQSPGFGREPLGTPSTRRRGRRRWSAWSQSSCGRNAGRSGSPLGRSCKEFKAKPRGCCQGSRMDFDLKVKRGIPVWLSLFSCGVSMSGGTGRFAQASSQES